MECGQAVMPTPYYGLREFGGVAVDMRDLAGEFQKALREGDDSSVQGHLEGFEESFHLVAGKRWTGSTPAKSD